MVDITHFKQLLEIDDIQDRDNALRRGFTAYTEPLDITGYESIVLVILLNLTYSRKLVDDLLDKGLAKKTLQNEVHLDHCLNEVLWLHTHNLKYPDIRVSKQRLILPSPSLNAAILSSANYEQTLGWSHDSAKVNFAKLFGSQFIWQGQLCCLATILAVAPADWKVAFQALGLAVKNFNNLCGRIKGLLPKIESPDSVDKFSIQVRMPYRDSYLSITPVISHVLQSELQKVAMAKQCRYTSIGFTRPASVGDLAASLGGNIKVLNYPPRISQSEAEQNTSWLVRVLRRESVLNNKVLFQKDFTGALAGLSSVGLALALKQRRQQKVASIKQIRSTLSAWLVPLLELRLAIIENNVSLAELSEIKGSLEYRFLIAENEQLLELLPLLFSLLNSVLSHSVVTSKYAFNQKLMKPLKESLKWLLVNISQESNILSTDDENLQHRYLYLKGIRVFDAQALSNPYCVGIPSLTAVWGMMHNYQRRLNERLGTTLRMTSFSWFIRQCSSVTGKKLPEYGMQGPKENQFRRAGILDNRYCDLVFDLVIHIDGYEEELTELDFSIGIIQASFPANFAGGVMHPPEIDKTIDWCALYRSEVLLYSKLRRLPASGKWIMPTRHSINSLDELLVLLKQNVSLCPVMMGYLLLEAPQARKRSIELQHCYAESAIGVVDCATAIDIRLQGMHNFFRRAFWMLDIKETSMLMKRI
ncbi:type I-F CRISPR-associated protein Csy2 [Shewanella sp. MEBiC00475]|uniref:type I-F CRISPR-associated protein Csy2 n=1 Tax=Shewanella sp. MEBiC00475 TaxID=2575361 RepID=UPI0010BF9D7A|nr:type I-F CRISPR-associated protein Csy2 [Shewanella sp. MEBiC00475]